MKRIMNLRFKRNIQLILNSWFLDEEYHVYTLGEFLKIVAIQILMFVGFFTTMIISGFLNSDKSASGTFSKFSGIGY